MGSWRFRRSKKIGPVRLNLTKTGVGASIGVPGARVSVHSSGRITKTVGIPGTGLYYRDDEVLPGSRATSRGRPAPPAATPPVGPVAAEVVAVTTTNTGASVMATTGRDSTAARLPPTSASSALAPPTSPPVDAPSTERVLAQFREREGVLFEDLVKANESANEWNMRRSLLLLEWNRAVQRALATPFGAENSRLHIQKTMLFIEWLQMGLDKAQAEGDTRGATNVTKLLQSNRLVLASTERVLRTQIISERNKR